MPLPHIWALTYVQAALRLPISIHFGCSERGTQAAQCARIPMRVRTRLLLFALVSVLLVCAAGYLGIANGRHVRDTQRETVLNAGPVIQQLETIKFSGLRIISGATDFGLYRLEDPIRNAARMRDEE